METFGYTDGEIRKKAARKGAHTVRYKLPTGHIGRARLAFTHTVGRLTSRPRTWYVVVAEDGQIYVLPKRAVSADYTSRNKRKTARRKQRGK